MSKNRRGSPKIIEIVVSVGMPNIRSCSMGNLTLKTMLY